jgi:DNA topoisomerase-3
VNALIIAEKPSLMRDIQSAYSKAPRKYIAEFTCFRGHFMELKEPNDYKAEWGKPWRKEVLPMIPSPFQFSVKDSCKADFKKIKDMLKTGGYDFIVNACDAGREGEAIFWTFYMNSGCKLPVKRLWASDTTDETLSKALDNLLDYDTDKSLNAMKDASLCRMYFDWLIGINLSRAATLQTNKLVPVGRVQTPTLNIVVTRDLEIENFKPQNYYEIEADFDKYKGQWFNPKTRETSFKTEADAKTLVSRLGNTGKVEDVKDEKVTEYAPALFSLAELQKDANRVLGFTAKETLEVAQSLYEKHKILSYPRTESRALSTNLAKEIVSHLEAIKDVPEVSKYVKDILASTTRISNTMSNKKYVDNKKVTDHHAIINTKVKPNFSKLTANEKALYLLVIKKFVSIFLDPYVTNKTTIVTDVSGEKFKTVGSVLVQRGYKELYSEASKDSEIPAVKPGDVVPVKGYDLKAKQTQPPKPYTDSTLIGAMQQAGKFSEDEKFKEILNETKGLGTSATRDGIIERLIEKSMLKRVGKTIKSTDFGKSVIKILDGKDVILPDLTASWEEKLQMIEESKLEYNDFMNEMEEYAIKQTKDFLETIKTTFSSSDTKEAFGVCPKCGADAIATDKYVMCRNYKKEDGPTCTFIMGKTIGDRKLPDTEIKKLLSKKPTKVMKFKSKAGKTFEAGLIYDDSDGKIKYSFAVERAIGKCPKCKSNLVDKGKVCACEKEGCDFFISKTICNSNLTDKDIEALITGKTTVTKKFFKNNKPWYAKLKYNSDFTKLEFLFDNSKK